MPESFVARYGYNIRASTFTTYTSTLGFKELTCFVEGPSDEHRDPNTYWGAQGQSKLFANLYEPIWTSGGTVNSKNYYANYIYQLLQVYGDKVRFWEVVNEPDFTTNAADISAWTWRAPQPNELANLQAPFYNYVRMLRITYEVVKKYHPEAYVTTGGVGYAPFLDALMRYSDNPSDGSLTSDYPRTGGAYIDAVSFHSYPSYALHYWDTPAGAFKYTRTSDYAVQQVLKDRQAMVDVLNKYGYDGKSKPAKVLLVSETNISRRTSEDRTGTDEMQRNFGIKTLVLAQKNDIKQLYMFSLGETVNAPSASTSVSAEDEIALMGLYENLVRDTPGSQKTTQQGQAFSTTSALLYGYTYDAARTAALGLPSGVDGAAFSNNGNYRYVLWAKALTDNTETAKATYSFPSALGLSSLQRREWDYAATNITTTQSAQNISLTSAPIFLEAGSTPPVVTTPTNGSGCTGTGGLTREQWDNVSGTSTADVPTSRTPSSSSTPTQLELTNNAFTYADRWRGYLCPPQAGTYTFLICADDAADLYLSSDADPTHKVKIASVSGWTNGVHDYTRYPSQRSASVSLQAGTRYYIEVLHKQGWGSGYLSVAWIRPDGTQQAPIPGDNLIPLTTTNTGTTAPGTITSSQARITVTFASTPTSAAAHVAPTLYNKARVLNFEMDDSPVQAYKDLLPIMRGGANSSTNEWCNGLRYSDGCGKYRAYTAAVAINGHNPFNNQEWLAAGSTHDDSKLTWAQAQEMLNSGWDIENHSDLHTNSVAAATQLNTLDALITARLNGYKASVVVVPTDYSGYCTAGFDAGYIAATSASQNDNLPFFSSYNDGRVALSSLPAPGTRFVYRRALADAADGESEWSQLNRLKTLGDALMAAGSSSSSEIYLQRVFTHGMTFNVMSSWLNYMQSISNDQLWVTTLREFSEYRRVSTQVKKTEYFTGKTLTIDLDYANVSANTRFQNLSLLVDSPGIITNITVQGADSSSYNPNTGLVNVYRSQNTNSQSSASGCTGTGGLTREQWDNVSGTSTADVPTSRTPSSSSTPTQLELTNNAFTYADRWRGYLCPPQAGTYTFLICADDAADLYLSSDADPTHKVKIASVSGWTNGVHDYTRYPSQRSASVSLQAGTRYYIEVLHKQGWGSGYLSVAWIRPDGTQQAPIPGDNLIPLTAASNLTGVSSAALRVATPESATSTLATQNELSVYPNPFSQQATVKFGVVQAGEVTVTLHNLSGQLLSKLYTGTMAEGEVRQVTLGNTNLRTGIYLLRMVTPTGVLNQKVTYTSN